MPAYNAARYIRDAIESVLDNGFSDFELVVIDDGSTDATVQVVESIVHPALRLIRQPRNLGVGATRRNAVGLMRGKYMALLDADDIAVTGRFERQADRLEAADGPEILGGALEQFGDAVGRIDFPLADAAIKSALLFHGLPLANPTVCMKLDPFRTARIGYAPTLGAEDYWLWVDALRAGLRFENLPAVLVRYRRHGESLTKRSSVEVAAAARVARARVAETYFPEMTPAERAALVNALSAQINSSQRLRDGVAAMAHAAALAPGVPGIDGQLMLKLLADNLIRVIRHGLSVAVVDNEMLEMMTESDRNFECWRAAENGALDMRIMTLIFG